MSSKFFTNEDNNTLLNKIEGIFKYRNIHFFDALTGYFRASGYFRIRPFVDKAEEIRILAGINIDRLIYEANKRGLLFIEDPAKSTETFNKLWDESIETGQEFVEKLKKETCLNDEFTPLNNRPEDIANQVYLFQDAKDSIPGISNLQNFFRKKIDEYKKLKHEPDIKKMAEAFHSVGAYHENTVNRKRKPS